MGTNSGVHLANYYLFTYELHFLRRLISLNNLPMIMSFKFIIRYLDDILVINNPLFPLLLYTTLNFRTLYGIYPLQAVNLHLINSGTYIFYLDVNIQPYYTPTSSNPLYNKLYTSTHDKRTEPKFNNIMHIKYPSANSMLLHSHSYNIVLSQCHRFAHLSMLKSDFINDLFTLLCELTAKGFLLNILLRVTKRFLLKASTQLTLYGDRSCKYILSIIKRKFGLPGYTRKSKEDIF